jgi:hypothetical protein
VLRHKKRASSPTAERFARAAFHTGFFIQAFSSKPFVHLAA